MCTTKCAFFFVLVGFCIYGPLRAFFWSSICTSVSVCVCVYAHMRVSDARPSSHPSVICRGFVALTRTCTKETGVVVV